MPLTQVPASMLANSGNELGMRNRIIDGNFVIAQRGTGATVTPSAGTTTYPSLDRWFLSQTGAAASLFLGQTTAQTTGVSTAGYFGRTSGQTNVPASIFMGQQIESKNMIDLRGQTITVSFNAFRGADAPATLRVLCRFGTAADEASSGGIGGSWTGFTSASAGVLTVGTTVASYTYSATVPSNASEMMLLFYYTPSGTAGANEWFALENVQLEKGSIATSFDYRPYGTELALCQRYYNTSYPAGTAIGSAGAWGPFRYTDAAGNYCSAQAVFPVTMRTTPTVTIYNTINGTAGQVSGDATNKTGAISGISPSGFFGYTNGVASSSGEAIRYNYTATAEM